MKQKNLYLLSGIPGAGKSTWAKREAAESNGVYISRDEVRFSIISQNDNYFSKENEVFAAFISLIKDSISNPETKNIYVDATHLHEKSRNKVLNQLNLKDCNLICVYFNVPLEVALERNAQRSGRALVPPSGIQRMFQQLTNPAHDKKYPHTTYTIGADGKIQTGGF